MYGGRSRCFPCVEAGQSLVEAALTVPAVIVLMMAVVQFGWVIYCDSCVSSALAHMQYSLTTGDLSDGAPADEVIRQRMIALSPVLASGSLRVSDASVEVVESKVETVDLNDVDFDAYRLATKNEMVVRVKISADVDYAPVALFPAVAQPHFIRHVEASKVIDERFELG